MSTPACFNPRAAGHGDVVDPGNVAQRLEGGDLQPQAHELIEVLLPVAPGAGGTPGRSRRGRTPR